MMKTIYSSILFRLAAVIAAVALLSSCADDLLEAGPGGVVDGSMRHLAVEISFDAEEEQPIDSRATDTALPGNSIQNINDLRILIYDANGQLINDMTIMSGGSCQDNGIIKNVKYTSGSDNRLPDEKDKEFQDDASGKVTFDITLPSANYYMYAVANAPDLTNVADRHAMKNTPRRWQVGNIAANSEMFGIFSVGPNRGATDEKPLSVTNTMTSLHCWLRRLASKVTVAFDGTELYDNVQVYIDTISLFDIPQQCLLGNPNTAGRGNSAYDAATRYKANTNGLIHKGPFQLIQDLSNLGGKLLVPDSYIHVCNVSHPYLGKGKDGNDPTEIDNRHTHVAQSLFFYENLQGTGNCKKQDADGDNVIDKPNPKPDDTASGWKDGKPYGTYVQVHGHYRCTSHDSSVSSGPIRYRFMLGKDTDKDFNAERNTHYQLTLKLKGYGNDADWHIEYEHKRGIVVASPQYISYLYNKKMMATVKVTGTIPDGCFLKAEIINEKGVWRPWSDGSDAFPAPGPDYLTSVPTNSEIDGPWVGFLSLRQTKVIKIENPTLVGAPSYKYDAGGTVKLLKNYYNGDHTYNQSKIGERIYKITPNTDGYESNETGQDGMYFVSATQYSGSKVAERVFSIPLYTRAKELVTWSGFTGNNPFEEFPRKQRIKFTVVKDDKETVLEDFEAVYLDVIQVPRITNPKGVWRSKNKVDNFHVKLTTLDPKPKGGQDFKVFNSMGKWSAEVIAASAPIITLSSTHEGSGSQNQTQSNVSRIEGESEHPIDFYINFNGSSGCAVVKVRYHNYTCEHDIFCRSGYEDPIDVAGNGQLWSSFNVDYFDGDKAVPTKSPLQEGSLFRRGCRTAILPINNTRYGLGVNPASVAPGTFAVKKSDKTTGELAWSNIKTTTTDSRLFDWTISNTDGEHIASAGDFYTLTASSANDVNFQINKGYGVLYGDGAYETQLSTAEAYGYDDVNGGPSSKGMRGVFVCNYNSYNQVFFPIGASGYGHRKPEGNGSTNKDHAGTMRYAGRSGVVNAANDPKNWYGMMEYRPLFYDLAIRPGAIYWTKRYRENMPGIPGHSDWPDNRYASAFDFNYFTMGFEGYTNDAIGVISGDKNKILTQSHACFIRTVFGEEK